MFSQMQIRNGSSYGCVKNFFFFPFENRFKKSFYVMIYIKLEIHIQY